MACRLRTHKLDPYSHVGPDVRFTPDAIDALHEVSEAHLVAIFNMGRVCALHRGSSLLQPKDWAMACAIVNESF